MKRLCNEEMKNVKGGLTAWDYCPVNQKCSGPNGGQGVAVIINATCACAVGGSFWFIPPSDVA